MAVKKRLGEMLVEAGIIDETQLHAALGHQRQWGGRLGACLVELKLASEEAIVDALALKFGFEIARLGRIEPYAFEQARAFVPYEYAVRQRIFPISADTSVLVVAMSDPTNLALADELAFKSGRRVKVCIAGENAIAAAIRAHYGQEVAGPREAIDLGADDGTAIEAVYDPIGATSSEQLSHFFDQPARPTATPPARASARAAGLPAAQATAAARVEAAAAPTAWTRSPAVLQLEDQPTGSIPLEPVPPGAEEEELQPLEVEPLVESEAIDAGQEALVEGYAAYDAQAADAAVPDPQAAPPRELTPEELQILEALDRFARGDDAAPDVVRPAQLVAALIRLMLRKQWITEHELLDEILRG